MTIEICCVQKSAQAFIVSNPALIHLIELLEVLLIVLDGDSFESGLVEFIQAMIAKEIVKRMICMTAGKLAAFLSLWHFLSS